MVRQRTYYFCCGPRAFLSGSVWPTCRIALAVVPYECCYFCCLRAGLCLVACATVPVKVECEARPQQSSTRSALRRKSATCANKLRRALADSKVQTCAERPVQGTCADEHLRRASCEEYLSRKFCAGQLLRKETCADRRQRLTRRLAQSNLHRAQVRRQ